MFGLLYGNLEDVDGCRRLLEDVLRLRREIYPEDHSLLARVLSNLGIQAYKVKDYELAGAFFQESLDMRRRLQQEAVDLYKLRRRHYGARDVRVAAAESSLGRALHAVGEIEEAEEVLRSVLDVRRELLGEDHLHTETTRKDLDAVLDERGRRDE